MFEGIREFLGFRLRRSKLEQKLDHALENAEALDHYFFFPDQPRAEAAAQRLKEDGCAIVSVGLHAPENRWLVQARQRGSGADLNELQAELDRLAEELGGEYDGWQVPGVTEDL